MDLDTRDRLKVTYSSDIIFAILFLIIGILVLLFGFSISEYVYLSYSSYIYYSGMISSTSSAGANMADSIWFWVPGWVISLLGPASLFYGIKRPVNNILKFEILKQM